MPALPLNTRNLPAIGSAVSIPRYETGTTQPPGIIHIGVGGFHRAHQAMYTDMLLNQGNTAWPICGVGLLPQDRNMRDALVPQDCLYTLVAQAGGERDVRVIGSIREYLFAAGEPASAIARMASPDTRIVSMTITEGAYYREAEAEGTLAGVPELAQDAAEPDRAQTAFGLIAAALFRRYQAGLHPFTVLSCDNMPGNGEATRRLVLHLAGQRERGFVRWVEEEAEFPNSMVDRITPATTEEQKLLLEREYGIRDRWPVFCESFTQWIIEDRFSSGRPAWENAGAMFVENVLPYELMKLRLLNSSHSALGYAGILAGYHDADRAMEDEAIRRFIRAYMREVQATLPEVPGVDLEEYSDTLVERFANPAVRDQLSRLAQEGSAKIPTFLSDAIREAIAAGSGFDRMALAAALWYRYLERAADGELTIVDRKADMLLETVRKNRNAPERFLDLKEIFGEGIADSVPFRSAFRSRVEALRHEDIRSVLREAD